MNENFYTELTRQLQDLQERNLYKKERAIHSPQGREVLVASGHKREKKVINMCANNYLGFAAHDKLIQVATEGSCSLRLRAGIGQIYLWHAGNPCTVGTEDCRVFGHGRRDPLFFLF